MIEPKEQLLTGATGCVGCGAMIAARWVLETLDSNIVVVIPAGCLATVGASGLKSAWPVPFVHSLFASAPAVATGIRHALDIRGQFDTQVVVLAGDSATLDIGFQALSGMATRGENILYICYDNEAAMNTSGQANAASPRFALTPTTPAGYPGRKKDGPRLMIAHQIPYVATASISHRGDLTGKLNKAAGITGPRYIHVFSPCPTFWDHPPDQTLEVARLAVEAGLWQLFEWENGKLKVTHQPQPRIPLKDYFALQGRFKGMKEEEVEQMQKEVDAFWTEKP